MNVRMGIIGVNWSKSTDCTKIQDNKNTILLYCTELQAQRNNRKYLGTFNLHTCAHQNWILLGFLLSTACTTFIPVLYFLCPISTHISHKHPLHKYSTCTKYQVLLSCENPGITSGDTV